MLAEAERHIRIQRQPAAVAAVDARAERRRSSGADAAGLSRQRSVDGADAAISEGTRVRYLRLADGPQHRRRDADARGAARPACPDSCRDRPQGQHRRLEPGRHLCARSGAAGAGHGAICRDAGKSVRGRRAGDQRNPALRGDVRRSGRGKLGASTGDRRRSAGTDHVDLFAHRRHRQLANLPAAPLRHRRKYRGAPCQSCRARRERGCFVGGRGSFGPDRGPIRAILPVGSVCHCICTTGKCTIGSERQKRHQGAA